MSNDPNLKTKLRYGDVETPFSHFTLIAEGDAGHLKQEFEFRPGSAFMGMKVWARTQDEAFEMFQGIGRDIGFTITGCIQLCSTEPLESPGPTPHGYDIKFTAIDPPGPTPHDQGIKFRPIGA